MDWNTQSAAVHSDPLDFARTAVLKVETVVAKSLDNQKQTDAFLQLLCSLLAEVRARLAEIRSFASLASDNNAEKRLLQLLDALEVLVSWPNRTGSKPNLNEPFRRENYKTLLHGLRAAKQQTTAKFNIQKLASGKDERSRTARLKFQNTFANFIKQKKLSNGTRHPPRGPPLAELVVSTAKLCGQEESSDYLCLLHDALCCKLHVRGHGGWYKTNIGLTYGTGLGKAKDEVPFDCFFLHRHLNSKDDTAMWKQVQIRVFLQSDLSKSTVLRWQRAMVSPQDFCGLICRDTLERHVFSVSRDGIAWESAEEPDPKQPFLLGETSVSLATILHQQRLENQDQLKLLLSYLLAKAVLQSYASAWMTPHWTKNVIHFMRQRLDLLSESHEVLVSMHKPYFSTEVRPTSSHIPQQASGGFDLMQRFPPPKGHAHPKVLALGIMLLEIELGKGIERCYPQKVRMENEDHVTAVAVINSDSWTERNMYQALRTIIEICIKGETDRFGVDESSARAGISTFVVEPLRRLFKQAWSLDQDPESFEPQPVSFSTEDLPSESLEEVRFEERAKNTAEIFQKMTLEQPQNPNPELGSNLKSSSSPYHNWSMADADISSDEDGALHELDDGGKTVESRQIGTNKWFKRFQDLLFQHQLVGRQEKPFRVAILDSGIDMSYFNKDDLSRIEDTKSFIGDDGGKDTSNGRHGTHIAAVILRLTKNVDLLIGKVTDSLKLSQPGEIAQAIKFAREDWHVDMISISFGVYQHLDCIKEEIDKCLTQNIVVFASASNDAGKASRTYPAEYERVLCVYSATYQGVTSEFNPFHGIRDIKHKFMFVGEHVRPVWRLPITGSHLPIRYQSGTSFATPVAVSVAAFMLGYIRKNMPDFSWGIKPQSPDGIERIFKILSFPNGDYHFVNLSHRFNCDDEAMIREKLKENLIGKHLLS